MSYESKEVLTLPSGLLLVTVVEDGFCYTTVQREEWDSHPDGKNTRVVHFRNRAESFRGPVVLSAHFKGGGWCDLLVCNSAEVEALGGFDAILDDINGFWAEPQGVMCG